MSRVSFALIHWQKKILFFFSVFLFSLFSAPKKISNEISLAKAQKLWEMKFYFSCSSKHTSITENPSVPHESHRCTDFAKIVFWGNTRSERFIIPTTRRDFPLFRHENATTARRYWGEIYNFQCFWHAHWYEQQCRMFQNKNHRFWILALLLVPRCDYFH